MLSLPAVPMTGAVPGPRGPRRRLRSFVLAGYLSAVAAAAGSLPSQATPLYSAREGRTCDNCHLTPNTWNNPTVAERKCTLSCGSCHVDPAGGGPRNAAGRFYGRSTLPMIATSPRPTQDWDREAFSFLYRLDRATTYTDSLPLGPDTEAQAREWPDPPRDLLAWGRPLFGPVRYAPFRGRFGAIPADPLFRLGWDFRLAFLVSQSALAFPMEADVAGVLHPAEHVTAVARVGARGRTTGFSDTVDDPATPYLREGYLLLHEAPYLSYVKAGRFIPSFGLRLDDHTVRTRREFDLDAAVPESRVTGIEAGTNPNYPFLALSWFKSAAKGRAPDAFDPFDVDDGWGAAANAGYRELSWSVGVSALARRRPLEVGGDETSFAAYGVLNPWRNRPSLPLTYQIELDFGEWTRASGRLARRVAFYQEIDWRAANGVNLLLAQDWSDPDREVKDDDAYRLVLGAQVTPVPGVTVDTRIRALLPVGDQAGVDGLIQLHLWN